MFEMTPFERSYRNLFARNPFADLEKEFFSNSASKLADFQTDVQDLGDSYLLEADLPGFDKKDIKIDINDHRLTIHAERHANAEHKDEKTGYIRQERTFGSFSRSFDINEIDESAISAAYVDGVLKLTLPKLQKPLPASHQIEIQ